MKQKYVLLKRTFLVLVLFFSTITFGMKKNQFAYDNYDFKKGKDYYCLDHRDYVLYCPCDANGTTYCDTLEDLKFNASDGEAFGALKRYFWNEYEQNKKDKEFDQRSKDITRVIQEECGQLRKDEEFDKLRRKKFKRLRLREKEQSNRSGVEMDTTTKRKRKLGFAAAAGTLLAGGIANGMETDDNCRHLSVATLNSMLAGEPFNVFSITEKDGKLKKTLSVNILDNPRFLPFTQAFARHIKDMHTEYNLPTCIAFVKGLRPHVLNPNSVSVYDAYSIIKFWTIRHSSKKVLCGQTEFKDPRTGGRVDVDHVSFYRIELGKDISKGISKNKNQSTTEYDKTPREENRSSSNFEVDLDQLGLVLAGEEVGEDVKIDKLLTLNLMGTLPDLIEFSRITKSESKDTTAWGNGQVISLFSKSTTRTHPSLKSLVTLGTLFKKSDPNVAIGFFQRLQDQISLHKHLQRRCCVLRKKHNDYQIAQWEFMADFYANRADDENNFMHKAINVCKSIGKNKFASTLNKTKAEEKLSKLQLEYDKSRNSDPASVFGKSLMSMIKAVAGDKKKEPKN